MAMRMAMPATNLRCREQDSEMNPDATNQAHQERAT